MKIFFFGEIRFFFGENFNFLVKKKISIFGENFFFGENFNFLVKKKLAFFGEKLLILVHVLIYDPKTKVIYIEVVEQI